jgi:phosphopantetheinyl transferase
MEEFAKELAADYPRIDYVIHGAGIDQSKALKSKTMEDMQRVIHPKAKGLASLLEALGSANIQVGKIIGFGSVSGRFGNRGQVDYSAANDGLAHYLRFIDRTSEMRAKIIHWPPWSDIGMASGGSVKAFLEEAGIDFISPGEGAEILKGEMTHWADSFEETVVCGRLGPFEWDAFHIPGLKVPAAVRLAGQEADIVSMIPDEFIRAKVLLSPGHPLLDHHRIDGTAILPGVGAIEIMRSATNLVSGGDRPLIKDVELKSPVKLFQDEPFTVEVRVNRRGALVYDARIVSRHMGPEGAPVGPERIHHECVLEYDTIAVESNERARLDDRESRDHSSWIPVSGIYRRFFHGPGFQFLNHLSFNSQGNRARFGIRDTGERPSMFNDNLPAIIEAAFQAAAGLAMERSWAMALPTGFRALSALGALDGPAYGFVELVREFDLKNMANRSGFEMDVTIFNAAGEEILKVQGIGLAGLSDPAAQNPWGYEKIYEEAVDLGEIEQLMSSPGKEAIGEILHQEEQTGLEGPKTQKRRLEWLGGRLAAKRAIRELLSRSGMKAPALNMMKLIPDESGRPVPALVNYDQPLDLHLSISHSHGRVIAAVTANPGVHGIGVDLEKIEPRTNSWARDYFNEEELKLANTLGAGDLALTMMWSIKEAALKAMGAGLRYDLKDMAVREIRENGAAVVDFQGDAARNPLAANGKDILIRVDSDGEMVVARALIEAK